MQSDPIRSDQSIRTDKQKSHIPSLLPLPTSAAGTCYFEGLQFVAHRHTQTHTSREKEKEKEKERDYYLQGEETQKGKKWVS